MKNALRDWGVFSLVEAAICLAVFGSALWGARILAPLDIAPAIFSAYRFVDPTTKGVPDNHYIIDQLTYDLPLQTVIYDAYRRGEIPWWDPYTYGGRPLLADAHINGTDPIRILCYLTLPFELAYNWNLVLHSLVAAAGMFALLRFWRFGLFPCITLAIAWQFSGAFVMHFGHPWIAGTFVWFPFIWICWERALTPGPLSVRNTALATLLCGASLYSGNLQSHLYLPLFGVIFLIGHFSKSWRVTMRVLTVLTASGIAGAALAAPVLANQVEFFLLSTREVTTSLEWWQHPARVLLSLGGVFPWATGTFRTLDIGKVVRSSGTGWLIFCGSATFVLALLGLFALRAITNSHAPLWKTSAGLVSIYFIIAGTPLVYVFYLRVAPLAVLGMVPLAAIGLHLLTSSNWITRPKLAWAAAISVLAMFAAINTATFVVYPAVKDQLTEAALTADSSNEAFPSGASALRRFQVENFPSEVSLLNPETILSLIALLLISAALGTADEWRRKVLANLAVIFSLLPLVGFAARFIPNHPTEMLSRLQAGGPTQKKAIELVREMQIFPYAMGALYRVHTVHGYSALQPSGIFRQPKGVSLEAGYGADFAIQCSGSDTLVVDSLTSKPPMGRFISRDVKHLSAVRETLNSLTLHLEDSTHAIIYRTDTAYPGWTAYPVQAASSKIQDIGTLIEVHSPLPENILHLSYLPRNLSVALCVATGALCLSIIALLSASFRELRGSRGMGAPGASQKSLEG
jgi:hypothetical protein